MCIYVSHYVVTTQLVLTCSGDEKTRVGLEKKWCLFDCIGAVLYIVYIDVAVGNYDYGVTG
jgi:hypothetical protein